MQFVFPYHLTKPICQPGDPCEYQLANNPFILPTILLAGIALVYLLILYPKVKTEVKFLPLVGAVLVMALLITINIMNLEHKLDAGTRHKIMEHLGAFG